MSEHEHDSNCEHEHSDDDLLLTLVDEEGNEHQFELVDGAEIDGVEYRALVAVLEDPEEYLQDSGELLLMRVTVDNEEEFLDTIEDDAEYEKVAKAFIERLSEEFDFEDGFATED